MELTKAEYAMYIGTLNSIVKLIDDKKLTAKKLRKLLLIEIKNITSEIKEH